MKAWQIRQTAVTASTNDDARRAILADEDAEGLVVWSLRQTDGRGRHGRVWESPEGNLYCSAVLRPNFSVQNFAFYSFVAALAVRDTVRFFLPEVTVQLKWPNDVLVRGKKISGLLLEVEGDHLILGVGLNVHHSPQAVIYPCTSLVAEGAEITNLSDILRKLLERLAFWREVIERDGFAPIRAAWLETAMVGAMTVKLPEKIIKGEFVDLDPDGCLRLRLANGSERAISVGDVFPVVDA